MVRKISNRCTPTNQQVNIMLHERDSSAKANIQMPPEAMSARSAASPYVETMGV